MLRLASPPKSSLEGNGLLVGRDERSGSFVRYAGNAHLVTLAMTGAGKFTNSLGPNLATYAGSVFCIDPKGQCAAVTRRARASAPLDQKVYVLNPFGLFEDLLGATDTYNPLDWLVEDKRLLIDHAMMLAEALVIEEGNKEDNHWNEQAKNVLLALIVHVCTAEKFEGRRNLVTVLDLLQFDKEGVGKLISDLQMSKEESDVVAGVGRRLEATPQNERGSILSTASRHMSFLLSPNVREVMRKSSFDVTELKSKRMSVYLVIPSRFIGSHNRWLRLMVTVAMLSGTNEHEKKPDVPVAWLLDELGQLGRLRAVAEGYSLFRGYGYRIWGMFQDLPQMHELYGERAKSMLSASVVQGFNVNCAETAEWFSVRGGKEESGGFSAEGPQLQLRIRADEVMELPRDTVLVKMPDERLFTCKKLVSWRDGDIKGLLDPDPYER